MDALAAAAMVAAGEEEEQEGLQPSKNRHYPVEGGANIERVGNGKTQPFHYHCRTLRPDGVQCTWRSSKQGAAKMHARRSHKGMDYNLYWAPFKTDDEKRRAHNEVVRKGRKKAKAAAAAAAAAASVTPDDDTMPVPGELLNRQAQGVIVSEEVLGDGTKQGLLFYCGIAKCPGQGSRRPLGNLQWDVKDGASVAVTWVMRCLEKGLTR